MKILIGLGSNRDNRKRKIPDERADIIKVFTEYKKLAEKMNGGELIIIDASIYLISTTKVIKKNE